LYSKQTLIFIGLLIIGTIWMTTHTGCAKIVAPTGGARDTIPPKVIIEKSTPNLSTNFNAQKIVLTFNEWVELNKPGIEIIVSPPLSKPINIKLKGKQVTIDLEEETLRENATYVINFGKSIRDFNEKNTIKDMRFVFSTGSFIDSLRISGSIIDIATEKPAEDVLVMLYDNLSDTAVRTEKPFYFTRTDKQGRYEIPYMKADTFQVITLIDENFNYLYDGENEGVGFLFEPIIVSDTFKTPVNLQIFQPQLSFRRQATINKNFGHLKFAFNQEVQDSLFLTVTPNLAGDYHEITKDTLHFWYTDTTRQRVFILSDSIDYLDTLSITLPKSSDFYKKNKTTRLTLPIAKQARNGINHNPLKSIEMMFFHPIVSVDTSKIWVAEDTTRRRVRPIFIQKENAQKELSIQYKWKEKQPYQITFLPGAVTDIFELTNDTIIVNYKMDEKANYGNIDVLIEGLNQDTSYVVELLDKNKNVKGSFFVNGKEQAKQSFQALPAGKYSLRVIEDLNKNGRWDTGEYPTRYPENIYLGKTEELRANWDLELKFERKK
jgi:hypothetical protein